MTRPFGVLQSRWGIVRHPALTWSTEKFWEVMNACVILHNMIMENERDNIIYDKGFEYQGENFVPEHQEPTTSSISK